MAGDVSEGSATGRGRRRDPAIDDRILDAVEALLAELEPAAITMEGVAAKAGVAKQTLYRRWPSRSVLLMDTLARLAARRAPVLDTGSLRGDLVALLAPAFAFTGSTLGGRLMRALAAEALADEGAAALLRARFVAGRRGAIGAALERAQARGEVGRIDADLFVDLAYGPLWYRLLVGHAPLTADAGATVAALLPLLAPPRPVGK